MAISILNNIASLTAQNQLASTQFNLIKTLGQLSSGSRINTGADDAAGLAIADGLHANVTALTQSAHNANAGVGSLQVADGTLAQVTLLLNRAITLATEASDGSVSNAQRVAIQAEYTAINTEISSIGSTTNYNGAGVFSATAQNTFLSDGVSPTTIGVTTGALSNTSLGLNPATIAAVANVQATGSIAFTAVPTAGDTVTVGGTLYTFVAVGAASLGTTANTVSISTTAALAATNLFHAINGAGGTVGTDYGTGTVANTSVTATNGTAGTASLTAVVGTAGTAGNAITLAKSATANTVLSAATLTGGVSAVAAINPDLSNALDAQTTLGLINVAIASVASQRGILGATVNRLQAASAVITNEVQNLTAAEDGIRAADIPNVVANLSRFTILNQSGISALAQANTAQQSILTLLR